MPITDRVFFAIHHPPTLSLEQKEWMEYHKIHIEVQLFDINDRMDAWMSLIQGTNDLSEKLNYLAQIRNLCWIVPGSN